MLSLNLVDKLSMVIFFKKKKKSLLYGIWEGMGLRELAMNFQKETESVEDTEAQPDLTSPVKSAALGPFLL